MNTARDNAWGLASGAWSVTGTIGALAAGVVLALMSLYFFMRDGDQMWGFFVRIAPKRARASMDRAGQAGWTTLRRYTQTSVFVAFIDAVGIGVGAWILGRAAGTSHRDRGVPVLLHPPLWCRNLGSRRGAGRARRRRMGDRAADAAGRAVRAADRRQHPVPVALWQGGLRSPHGDPARRISGHPVGGPRRRRHRRADPRFHGGVRARTSSTSTFLRARIRSH